MRIDDLKLCYSLLCKIADIGERIQRTRSLLTGSHMPSDLPSQSDFASDRIGDGLARIEKWEKEMREAAEAYLDHVRIVDAAIEEIPDQNQQRILRLRYMDGLNWEEIGERTYFSPKWCRELHNRGITALGIERLP